MMDTILFDLDNTLLDFDLAERIAIKKTLLHLKLEPTEKTLRRYSELNLAQWKLLEQGKLTRSAVKTRRFRILFEELGIERSVSEAAQTYESLLGAGHYFMDGAEELLHALAGKYRLYLVTNGTARVQKSRMQSAGLHPYFEDVFISEEIGFDKPSREYFEHCFARIPNFCKQSAAIVGDSLTSDIQGGKNAGIATIWYNPGRIPNSSSILPDYEIHHLSEVEMLLS